MEATVTLIEELREAIRSRDLAQHEAAAQIGISKRTIENWLTGKSEPWPRHRRAIRAWLATDEVAA